MASDEVFTSCCDIVRQERLEKFRRAAQRAAKKAAREAAKQQRKQRKAKHGHDDGGGAAS